MPDKIKIASVILTFNRIEEVKAQMDIVREAWQPMFDQLDIYHEYNGSKKWYPEKYKEDFIHRHKTMPHFVGVNHMLNQGIKHVLAAKEKYDYIIVTSADTWFYDPKKLRKIIDTCRKNKFQLVTSLWGLVVFGTEFFIITPDLAQKVFPLRFNRIISQYNLLKWAHSRVAVLEALFTLKVMKILKKPNKIYLIPGRIAVWPKNRYWSANFYASHHDKNKRKKDILPGIRRVLGGKFENMPSLNQFIT